MPPGKNNNRLDHLAQTGIKLPQIPFATCPVHRKNQILLTSQSLGETTSELPLVMELLVIRPRKAGGGTLQLSFPTSCPTRGAAPFPTKPNTRIGCQRIKSRTFTKQTKLVVVPGFLLLFVCLFLYY
jgi:hypothetical protein